MRVLVACEFSGVVRNAFVTAGHDAMSCDILPSETPRPDGWDGHYQGDVLELLTDQLYSWDLMICHPPCTYLANSANRWLKQPGRLRKRVQAARFAKALFNANIPRIALENPLGGLSTYIRKPDQIIQPWQFGHGEVKRSCLWLKGLPPLIPTDIVEGRQERIWRNIGPSPTRGLERSRTLPGIAKAMAQQWGNL